MVQALRCRLRQRRGGLAVQGSGAGQCCPRLQGSLAHAGEAPSGEIAVQRFGIPVRLCRGVCDAGLRFVGLASVPLQGGRHAGHCFGGTGSFQLMLRFAVHLPISLAACVQLLPCWPSCMRRQSWCSDMNAAALWHAAMGSHMAQGLPQLSMQVCRQSAQMPLRYEAAGKRTSLTVAPLLKVFSYTYV